MAFFLQYLLQVPAESTWVEMFLIKMQRKFRSLAKGTKPLCFYHVPNNAFNRDLIKGSALFRSQKVKAHVIRHSDRSWISMQKVEELNPGAGYAQILGRNTSLPFVYTRENELCGSALPIGLMMVNQQIQLPIPLLLRLFLLYAYFEESAAFINITLALLWILQLLKKEINSSLC
ncbi:CTL-like protein [Gossypium australe]|uniref:CTL-like protein n=1 Tax=Gossypium australe TaxID=47621 RepID=A0A5B6URQ1_9ROSI|nr:CTL-like protein [Gossypium australe]